MRQRAAVRTAAAAVDTDISALFRDALATPTDSAATSAKKVAAAASEAAPPAPAVTVDPVPGTELLRTAPPPTEPPTPSQGMDFVLEQLQNKPPGYGDDAGAAVKASKAAAKPLADSMGDAGAAAGKGLSSAADGAAAALGGAADAAAGAGKAASEAAAAAAAQAAAAAASLKESAAGLKGALGGAATDVTSGTVDAAQRFLEGATKEFNTEVRWRVGCAKLHLGRECAAAAACRAGNAVLWFATPNLCCSSQRLMHFCCGPAARSIRRPPTSLPACLPCTLPHTGQHHF